MTKLLGHLRLYTALVWLLLILTVGIIQLQSVSAQSGLPSQASQTDTLTGWLNVAYGDPPPESNNPPVIRAWLSDARGRNIAYLLLDENTARTYRGQQIQVTVQGGDIGTASVSDIPTYVVIDVQPLLTGQELRDEGDISAQLSGSQSYITLLCHFPGETAPEDMDWYQGLMANTYPGLGHYWQQTSYNNINLNGSFTSAQWYTMPHPAGYYLPNDNQPDTSRLAQDCVTAANTVTPSINFLNYIGINLMFDGELGCCAWGGTTSVDVEGQKKRFLATWMPDWGDLATIGHEMGHGFGLPHSSGPAANPPSGLRIYVSSWDIMSRSSHYLYSVDDPTYGDLPPGTIAYHRDMLNWIPANRKINFFPGEASTITLEQLQQPQTNSNYLLAKISIGGSPTQFYTVEARTKTGYDQSVPGVAVIIHRVSVNRPGNAGDALVVDGDTDHDVNDDGAIWLPGETFTDAANKIEVRVVSATATSFTVYISNNVSSTAAPNRNYNPTDDVRLSWSPVSWALGYSVQVDEVLSFADPIIDVDLPNIQFDVDVSLPDGIYYWRVCAWRTPMTCNAWSSVERLVVKST